MKQSVNPAVIVAAIVAVVAVACFFGFRALFPPNASSNLSPADYQAKLRHNQAAQQQNVESMKTHAGGMGGSSGYAERQKQYMQQRGGPRSGGGGQ